MCRFLLVFFLGAFVAAQIDDGCINCGLPDHPNCQWGECTTTCGWCRTGPPQVQPEESIDLAGENCLPYDGSEVPDCSLYINPDQYVPFYHQHSSNCSRFWECGPEGEACLLECVSCPLGPMECPDDVCQDRNGKFYWSLFFDDRFNYWPEGPSCVWPADYEGDCTMEPAKCP